MSVDLWNQLYNTVLNEWLWPLYSAETRTVEVKIEIRSLSSFMKLMYVCVLSHVRLFATTWTIAHQSPLSMEFSRQEYWSGLSFPPPRDLPDPGIEPISPASAQGFFTTESPVKLIYIYIYIYI